jgi:hypothetical protein
MVNIEGQALVAGNLQIQKTAVTTDVRGCAGLSKRSTKVGIQRFQTTAGGFEDCHSKHWGKLDGSVRTAPPKLPQGRGIYTPTPNLEDWVFQGSG